MAANWTRGNDIAAYNVANKISANVSGFYTPSPGSLYNAYASLILSIDPGKNAEGKLQKDTMAGPFNSALSHARFELTNDKNSSNYQRLDGSIKRLPTITIGGNLGADLANWKMYGKDEYDFDVTISNTPEFITFGNTLYRDETIQPCLYSLPEPVSVPGSKTMITGAPATSTPAVKNQVNSISSAGKASPNNRLTPADMMFDRNFELRVRFKGFKSYTITFGNWFSPSFVNPETARFSPGATVNSQTFFSKKQGSLHLLPSQIWIIYRPKIELTVSTDFYHNKLNKGEKVTVDPSKIMTAGLYTAANQTTVKVEDKTTTITYDSPILQSPQIFGVTSIKRFIH